MKYSSGSTLANSIQPEIDPVQLTDHMGPLKPYQPPPAWKSASMGFIPNANTTRALFMNSFLPEFYKAKYKHCQNRKDFVKQFHGTGRQLYQLKQQIDGIEKQIDSDE